MSDKVERLLLKDRMDGFYDCILFKELVSEEKLRISISYIKNILEK